VITVSASGSGWATWKVVLPQDPQTGTAQADLDFSATRGVLQAGQTAVITVSLDSANAQDGNMSETFVIAGVSVRADLPGIVAPPSADPSPGVTIDPTAPPSDVPSSPSS
jgi:hypothetical protein